MMLKDVIRDARNELGLKQDEVAQEIGVTKYTYLKWENGTTEPKASQIVKLAKALKVSTEEICTGKRNQKYSLQDFIARLSYYRASREIEIMEVWSHINDHEKFFKDINHNNYLQYEQQQEEKEQAFFEEQSRNS